MQFSVLLKEHDILDIVTVDETHYAIVSHPMPVPGCVTIPVAQIHTRLRDLLTRGYSQRHKQPYRQLVGLASWALFTYSLETLPPSRKQVFSHALMGAGGRPGLLRGWSGQKLGRSAFLVPLDRETEALSFLARWSVTYTREVVLRG